VQQAKRRQAAALQKVISFILSGCGSHHLPVLFPFAAIWSAGACSRFRIAHEVRQAERRQAAALQKITGFILSGCGSHHLPVLFPFAAIWSAGACSRFRIAHEVRQAKRRQAAALQKITGFF
jgi:ribosomal protein L28